MMPFKLGGFTTRVKSLGETVKTYGQKVSDTIDTKLDKVQNDLERLSKKAAAADVPKPKPAITEWRPSTDNPHGEISIKEKPSLSVSGTVQTPPEPPVPSVAATEPVEIKRRHRRRVLKVDGAGSLTMASSYLDHDNDSLNESSEAIVENNIISLGLTDMINEIIEKEIVMQCLTDLIDTVLVVDELIEKTLIITPTKEKSETRDEPINLSERRIDVAEDTADSSAVQEDRSMEYVVSSEERIGLLDPPNARVNVSEEPPSQSDECVDSSMKGIDLPQLVPDVATEEEDTPEKNENLSGADINILESSSEPENEVYHFVYFPQQFPIEHQPIIDTIPFPTTEDDQTWATESVERSLPALPIVHSDFSISMASRVEEKKQFSIVNSHSLPTGMTISHLSCSATYVYICTNHRTLFYAKLNNTEPSLPLVWQRYSEPAERLVVSVSNRTVWRLIDKHLYSANDPLKLAPIGMQWNEIKISIQQTLLSMCVDDRSGWYIKSDGTLWLIRLDDRQQQSINVSCPFHLSTVVCSAEKVGVTTSDGDILIRIGCTSDRLEGDGWIFIQHDFGPIDDFTLTTNNDTICIVDKQHRLWIHQWQAREQESAGGFFEVLLNDNNDYHPVHHRHLITVSPHVLCFSDSQQQIHVFSGLLTGIRWSLLEKNARLQHLIGAFPNENHVWALTNDGIICSSNGDKLEKPRQAQYLTNASFVPDVDSRNTILWSLDESCNIYVRANVDSSSQWEQLDQSQFEWNRKLIHVVCSTTGVWAVDDQGYVHFRHGHVCSSLILGMNESSSLPAAWISVPGRPGNRRSFAQVYCGPANWMVYATDNKQNVYARHGINDDNPIGTSWIAVEDCSALELAISETTLWLLTSHGCIQYRNNISPDNPVGTQSTTLPGRFRSLTVSVDDTHVWALDSQRHLSKLDRLTVLFESEK